MFELAHDCKTCQHQKVCKYKKDFKNAGVALNCADYRAQPDPDGGVTRMRYSGDPLLDITMRCNFYEEIPKAPPEEPLPDYLNPNLTQDWRPNT